MPNTQKLRLQLEIKEIGADGSFEGILASYNTVDLGGDSILPGAFTKTLQEHGAVVPLLWQHKTDEPIGTLTLTDSPTGLLVKGQLLMGLPTAQKAYLLLKARVIKGMSIGYDAIKDAVENGVRILKEIRLWEGSVVTFPMNPAAMVTAIKAHALEHKDDFTSELAAIQIQDAAYQMYNAFFSALSSTSWSSEMADDEIVAASEIILEQFRVAYLEYLPLFLAYLREEYGSMQTMSRKRMATKALNSIAVFAGTKKGAKYSAATMKHLTKAKEHVDGLVKSFQALLPEDADTSTDDDEDDDEDGGTSDGKAADGKTEPEQTHSGAVSVIDSIKALIPKK
jgi:HK97 family phage prohead protease